MAISKFSTYLPSETEPVDSEAARALSELAMNYTPDRPLYIVSNKMHC